MRSLRSRQLFLLSLFTLFLFFSPTNSKFLDLRRRLDDAEEIPIEMDLKEFTIYDLEFSFTIKETDAPSIGDTITVQLFALYPDGYNEEWNVENIPLLHDLKTENGIHTIHVYQRITKKSDYFTGDYAVYALWIDAGNEKYYKGKALNILMVDAVKSDLVIYPLEKIDIHTLTYFEDNKFELTVTNGTEQKAVYAKIVKMKKDSTESIYEYKPYAALENGHLTIENNFKDSNVIIITYNSQKSINYISKSAFVTCKDPIQTSLRRNIYIKYNDKQHTFTAYFESKSASDYITAITEAKFVSEDKSASITLIAEDQEEAAKKTFSTSLKINDLPTGVYDLYVTMGGMKDVLMDKKIYIYDDFFKIFNKELSGIYTCNFYKSNQKYNLFYNLDFPLTTSNSHIRLIQNGITHKFEENSNKKTFNFPKSNLTKLKTGDAILIFYENADNTPEIHNFYRLNITLTDFAFDCGDDLCQYCSTVNKENSTGHEVFETYDKTTQKYISTVVLQNVICDASELNITFVRKSDRHVITPTCSYNSEKLSCTWENVDRQCYGGNYEIYVEGIYADFFNYYCRDEFECISVTPTLSVTSGVPNKMTLTVGSPLITKRIEHYRLYTNANPRTCAKYYRPDFSHDDSSYTFYYYKEKEDSTNMYLYITPLKKVIKQFDKVILDDYKYYDCFEEKGIVPAFTIPCENHIVLRKNQEITLKWELESDFTTYKKDLYYYTELADSKETSTYKTLDCKDIDENLETICTINTENILDPSYLVVGINNFISDQKVNLITYTTNLDTCQELIPGKKLQDVIIELEYPKDVTHSDITPIFYANTTIVNRTKDTHYTVQTINNNDKFTFTIENNDDQLKAGNYTVEFNYICAEKNKKVTFSKAKSGTNSYDADFVLRAYMDLKEVTKGNTLYTPEENDQILEIKTGRIIPEVPSLKFVNGNHIYTLSADKGTFDNVTLKLTYNVNLYSKRDELIRGTYEIYYISTCPNDPDIDTGLTVFFEYNILESVNKECFYSGHVNTKIYTLTYKYKFEVEWRQPKKIYGVYGTNVIDTSIGNYEGNTVEAVIITNLNKEGNYNWAFEFNDKEKISSNIELYTYMNLIEGHNKRYAKILQSKNLTGYKIVLEKNIRDDQLASIDFNFYNTTAESLSNFTIESGKKVNKYVQINNKFVLWDHIGTANFRLKGRCYEEDKDYEDVPFEVIPNCTLCTGLKDDMVFTRSKPSNYSENIIEITSQCYEIRELQKVRFKKTNKCDYPNPTSEYVYYCTQSLIDEGDKQCNQENPISFVKFGGEENHYARFKVEIDAEFAYEYTLDRVYDYDETCIITNDEDEELVKTTTETEIIRIVDNIKQYKNEENYHLFEGLTLRDYDDSKSQYIYEYKKGMNNVTYSVDFLTETARDSIINNISCSMTNNECQTECKKKGDTSVECTFSFNPLTTNNDISVYFRTGTCAKLLYIVRPDLDSCTLVTDATNLVMNLYTENELPDYNIYITSEEIKEISKIGKNDASIQTEFKSNDKITKSNYRETKKSSAVSLPSDLFSAEKTTYYYFKFIKNEYNQFILTDAIIKKLGLVLLERDPNEISYTQTFYGNLSFTFKSIFDKDEINTIYIQRDSYPLCDFELNTYVYNFITGKEYLENSNFLTTLDLTGKIEYGIFYPHYKTNHCPEILFTSNKTITINPPEIELNMTKKGVDTEECQAACCPEKMVHHIKKETSIFEFTNKYILNTYDLPDYIQIEDKSRKLKYQYKIDEVTEATNKFSFTIPIEDQIKPGIFTVTVIFECIGKNITMDKTIFIYENDVIFYTTNLTLIDQYSYYSDYEKHFKPSSFPFEFEILTEQIKYVTEEIYECTTKEECDANGCENEENCELKSRLNLTSGEYTLNNNGLLMNKYINERYTKEKRHIIITDIFCQNTTIGIKSKPNNPYPFEVKTDMINVCNNTENEITIKFPCKNYDIKQVQKITFKDKANISYTLGSADIEYNTDTFEIKFKVTVADESYITLLSFTEQTYETKEISLLYEYIKSTTNGCLTGNQIAGYTLATYYDISEYDYYIYDKNEVIVREIEFLDNAHANDALKKVNSINNTNHFDSQLDCKLKASDSNILLCNYTNIPKEEKPKRVKVYVDNRCNSPFDIITLKKDAENCQYYTETLKNYKFTIAFDESIESYLNPNNGFTIKGNKEYNLETESITFDLIYSNNVIYTYQYNLNNIQRYANFTFQIMKERTIKGVKSHPERDIGGEDHYIIGDVIPYKAVEEITFNKYNDHYLYVKIANKREKMELKSMKLYYENYTLALESSSCGRGSSDTEIYCIFDLTKLTTPGYYYITIVDTCNYESPKRKTVYVKIYVTPNFLTSINIERVYVKTSNSTSLTYVNDLNVENNYPVDISFVHASDNAPGSDYGASITFQDFSDIQGSTRNIKVNLTSDPQNGKEGLFKIKTTYKDGTTEISDSYLYIGSFAIYLTDDNISATYELGTPLKTINITFKNNNFKEEQIKEIRLKSYNNKNDDILDSILPRVNFKKIDNGITVYLNETTNSDNTSGTTNGLTIDQNYYLKINDIFYANDLLYSLLYSPPNDYQLVNDLFFITYGEEELEFTVSIEMYSEQIVTDNKDKFYIKSCCSGADWVNLNCTEDSSNPKRINCPYKEKYQLLSPETYTISYNTIQDIPLVQRKIYVNPSVISAQDYSEDIENQLIIYTKSTPKLDFYLNNNTKISLSNATKCSNANSYMILFKEVKTTCKKKLGKFPISATFTDSKALEKTYIRDMLCTATIDIKAINDILYSAKPDLQEFTVELSSAVSEGYISSIIFEREKNTTQKFETEQCTYTSEDSTTFKCTINLTEAVQGDYTVYYTYGNNNIVKKSSSFSTKYFKNYREIVSFTPNMVYAYEDTPIVITFNAHFDYSLVRYLTLVDKDNKDSTNTIILEENLENPVEYPIVISKGKYTTGNYNFKVNFDDSDDTFTDDKNKLFILEKQEFKPLPKVVLKDGNSVTLRIQHVKTTVNIKKVTLCGYNFTTENGLSTYTGPFEKCDDLVPKFYIDEYNKAFDMDFSFIIIDKFTDIYTVSALDDCLYYKLDQYTVSLSSISTDRIDLSSLTVKLTDGENDLVFTDTTESASEDYKQYKLTFTNEEDRTKLMNGKDWNLEILGDTTYKTKFYTKDIQFTDLTIPEYVIKEDTTIKFTNVRCKLITPFIFTFTKGENKQSVTFTNAELKDKELTMTLGTKLPQFIEYGKHELYLTGASKALGTLFVSNTLKDSTFTIEYSNLELTQNMITVKSTDFYCKLINEFDINTLGYQKHSTYVTINNGWTNKNIVTLEENLSNPAVSELAFIVDDSYFKYKHDLYNYQFEITRIQDVRGNQRKLYNKYLYYEGQEYQENIKLLSSILFVSGNTNQGDTIYIPIELINNGESYNIKIDDEVTSCSSFEDEDYTTYNLKKSNDVKYVKCAYTFDTVKQIEFTYKSNPCFVTTLSLATYLIDGPTCLTLGQEELSNEPTTFTIETPRIDSMMDITTQIGQYTADKKEIQKDNDNIYKLVFTYNTMQESTNYNYQILLNNDDGESIVVSATSDEVPQIYKYVDMESIDGFLDKNNKDKEITVNLYSPIREKDLPTAFLLISIDTKDTLISTSMELDTNVYKSIKVKFDMSNAQASEYVLYYINPCDKRVSFSKHLTTGETNSLYSVKHNADTTTLTLTYNKVIGNNVPTSITLKEAEGDKSYTYGIGNISKKDVTVKITDTLRGLYNITTNYGTNATIAEQKQVYLNGNKSLEFIEESQTVKDGYNVDWFELTLNGEAYDGLFIIGYQKYTGESDNEEIADIGELKYVIEPTSKTTVRFYTSSIIFKMPYKYKFYLQDRSSGKMDYHYITVNNNTVQFKFEKHFYSFTEANGVGIKFTAEGVANVYAELSTKSYYYNDVTKGEDGKTFTYKATNPGEIITIYYDTTGDSDKKKVGETLYVYNDISELFTLETDQCVYLQNKEFSIGLKLISTDIQRTFLTYKMGDTEIKESNPTYTFKEYSGVPIEFKIIDDENTVLYTRGYTFTDITFLNTTAYMDDDGIISFYIDASCEVKGLTIVKGTNVYKLTCNQVGSTTQYQCLSEKMENSDKVQTISIYSKGVQIKEMKVYTTYKKATITMTKPSIIYTNVPAKIKLSSSNYDLSKIEKIVFQRDNEAAYNFTDFTPENNVINFNVTLYTDTEVLKITQFIVNEGNNWTVTKFKFTASKFGITADQFFSVKDEYLNIQFIASTSGSITLTNAATDKGLNFGAKICYFNQVCKLKLDTLTDYTGKLGDSVLTVYYQGGGSDELSTHIYIRETDPKVKTMIVNENPKIFEATFDQEIFSQYISTEKIYFKMSTQSQEFKCTSTRNSENNMKVDITCPVSYQKQGFAMKAYSFGSNTTLDVKFSTCDDGLVLNDGECVTCKTKSTNTPLYYDGKCYKECPTDTYEYEDRCYTTCPNSYKIENKKCVSQCSDGYGLLSTLQTECKDCRSQDLYSNDGYCVKDCPKGLKYVESKKKCTYVLRITVTEKYQLEGYCQNNGTWYEENGVIKCKCANTGLKRYYGSTCSYQTEDEAKVENNKLYVSIFAYGKLGKDGKIQEVVPINYDSEELLSNLADLIDGLRNSTFNPDTNFTARILAQAQTLVQEVMEKFNKGTSTQLSKDNIVALLTMSIEIELTNGALRRLSQEDINNLHSFIKLMKQFVANTNQLEDGEEASISPNSFGLFNVKTYKNTDSSIKQLLEKTSVDNNSAKLAYITLKNCQGQTIPSDATYHLLESTDSKINLTGLEGLSVDGIDESYSLTQCTPTYSYKTACEDGKTVGGSTSEYSYVITQNENKGVNFNDANDDFYNKICYRVPDAFEYDITYKARSELYPSGISIEDTESGTCKAEQASAKCGGVLNYECSGDALPKSNVDITPAAPADRKTDYNLVTKCAKDATKLGKNTGFLVYLIFTLLMLVAGIIYVIIDIFGFCDVTDEKKIAADANSYANCEPYKNDGQNDVEVKGRDDYGTTTAGRSFCEYFRNNFLKLHPLTSHFFLSIVNPVWLKIIFFVCEILILFGFNSILFKQDYINNRMSETSRNSFGYPLAHEFTRVICSIVIAMCITLITRAICFVPQGRFGLLKDNLSKENLAIFNRNVMPRRIVSVIILLAIVAVSWYYSTAFCYIYHKTQKGWIYGGIWSVLFDWVILAPLYIAIISAVETKSQICANTMKKLFLF